jgi:PAT family beta-lactamase induction signal transducer AmpG
MKQSRLNGFKWIPTLYFAEGLPYIAATEVAIVMFATLGLSNTYNAFYTSLFLLPSIFIKFIFAPFLDLTRTKRFWILLFQWLITLSFAAIAFSITAPFAIKAAVLLFIVLTFNSALHDIAADGFYMLALDKTNQSFFVGIRNIFFRLANIFAQGLLVAFAGFMFEGRILKSLNGKIALSWSIVYIILTLIFALCAIYHTFKLPKPILDKQNTDFNKSSILKSLLITFKTFFIKKDIWLILFFLLTYRLGEAQLTKIAKPFLMDAIYNGGLALKVSSIGLIYGTSGVAALLFGGILGGVLASRHGLKKWILPMALFINVPDILYVMLAHWQPANIWFSAAFVIFEQFGYGFGFTAYMLFILHIADGRFKTAHYAFGTGIMALSMFIPGLFAGKIQDLAGYENFFIWVCISTLPGIIASLLVKRKML